MRGQTIGERIEATGGYATGWDYLRVVLAVGVLLIHSLPLSHGEAASFTMVPPLLLPLRLSLLPMFFALSGFLVSSSLSRVSIPRFVGLRVLRIYPALVVEVFLSALILGPLLTSVPLADYFGSETFRIYFKNTYGDIHYFLPGVFLTNPFPGAVNGSLWTVPFELECYAAIVALGLFRFVRHWQLMLLTMIVATAGIMYLHYGTPIYGWVDGRMLVLYFLAGVTLYSLRDLVPMRSDVFLVCGAFSLYATSAPHLIYLSPLPLAYCTAWIGLQSIPKAPVLFSGDYSYGIYLYAFPIQQAVTFLSPPAYHQWYFNAPISLVLVSLFAAFSWHAVEKPTLKLKRFIKSGRIEKRDAAFEKERKMHATARPDVSSAPEIIAWTLTIVVAVAALDWISGPLSDQHLAGIRRVVAMERFVPKLDESKFWLTP